MRNPTNRQLETAQPDRPSTTAVAILGSFHSTDLGNAEQLIAWHGAELRWCDTWKSWLFWDGRRWQTDTTRHADRLAIDTVRAMYAEGAKETDPDRRDALRRWAFSCEADHKRRAMVHTAGALLSIDPEDLDGDPWLLNVENGTIDLRFGTLGAHLREDMITKLAPVIYDPAAAAPTWLAFLDRIMAGNPNLIGFLQRAIGYSLTGETREQVLLILHGTGANGKSTLLETLGAMLGDYATQAPTETLLLKRGGSSIPNDVASLRGARLATASEAEDGQRLAESQVKQMTGGDTLKVRKLYQDYFSFRPTFKLWLATNHKPRIRGTDLAIWRRIRLIPFAVTIPEAEQDKALPAKLEAELPGILAWAVRGCLDWQEHGLGTPAEVRQATAAYQAEQDVLAGFFEDCIEEGPRLEASARSLHEAYVGWCGLNGERPMSKTELGRRLQERGFEPLKGAKGQRLWLRLGLRTE